MPLSPRSISAAAIFAAFVAAATMVLSVSVPSTGGYFNVGEIMVYTSAILMGPYVGAFAGGVGAMIADLALGFPVFAPGTLVIKGIEGFIVGWLCRMKLSGLSKDVWRGLSVASGLLIGGIVWWVGSNYYFGDMSFSLPNPISPAEVLLGGTVYIPQAFWTVIAILAFAMIVYFGFNVNPKAGWTGLAVVIGGVEMVLGYFLYEFFVLGMGWVAVAEVPFNIGQLTVGLLVGVPLAGAVRRIISPKVVAPPPSK